MEEVLAPGARQDSLSGDADGGFRLLFEKNPSPMWVYDAATLAFREVNEAAIHLYGYSREEFLGMRITDIRPEHDVGRVIDVAAQLRTNEPGHRNSGQWRHRRRNGDLLDVVVHSHPLRLNEVDSVLVLIHDVTERVKVEQRLHDRELQFRVLFENNPQPMWVFDRETLVFLEVNDAAIAHYGYSRDEFLVMRAPDIRPLDDVTSPLEALVELRNDETGRAVAGEWRHQLKDGRIIDVETLSHPVSFQGTEGVLVLPRDVTDRNSLERQLRQQAFTDPLTGLANRALFRDRIEHALARSRRTGGRTAVIFLDLDGFKPINDTRGHSAGDRLLVIVAQRLLGHLRPADTAARLGGDEFALLLEDTEVEEAREIAARVIDLLKGPILLGDGHEVRISASLGLAFNEADTAGAEELMRHADMAMYNAKARGRGRYEVFEPAMHAALVQRAAVVEELGRATDAGELRLVYQPFVHLASADIAGMEALVRWQHPVRGLLGPGEFITLAEETSLIVPLGAWVLESACRDLASWDESGGPAPRILSVNLSARQLRDDSLHDTLVRILRCTGLDPSRLCLEITESVLMDDVSGSIAAMSQLKRLGIRLAIDDFGTGYSSLSYLSQFPVDMVKIDRSFVAGLGRDPAADAIIAAVVNLAHALGLTVVAEGVERDEQLVALRALGCDRAQGFLWSAPLPLEELRTRAALPTATTVLSSPVDLHAILVQRTEALRAATSRAIVLQAGRSLPAILGDGGAVKSVLDHLLGNAVTYSGADRPVVVTASADRRWVRIDVADYGIGMSAEEAARCFEPFWQAQLPGEPRPRGTGVGLYIVRSLVEAMGGHVAVKSAPGKGSTFTVALPRSPRPVARVHSATGDALDVGERSSVQEFMRQIGVPMRKQ